MKNAVFVDTGAFIALANAADQYHQQAAAAAEDIELIGPRVTTPFVLVEACTYLQRRVNFDAGRLLWGTILSGEAEVRLLPVEEQDLERAHQIAVQYADHPFSWTDCTSFAFIERQKITRV